MPDIFKVGIADKIYRAFSSLVFDFTLTVITPGTRGGNLTAGTSPTSAAYTVKGFIDSYQEKEIDGTIIQIGDRKGVIFGGSLASGIVPKINDTITAEGETRQIINVIRDPAGATYECQLR